MTFGLMGLFRRVCPVESPTMRYLSDSAYWLYLAHLPLIIAAQYVVRDWPLPALAKFLLIVVVVTAFLLWTYQTLVRYTWLGRFLNGPRVRPAVGRRPRSSREAWATPMLPRFIAPALMGRIRQTLRQNRPERNRSMCRSSEWV